MTDSSQYCRITNFCNRRAEGFEPIADAIARVKARVEQAIIERDSEAGAEAHDALVQAEHRERTRNRMAGKPLDMTEVYNALSDALDAGLSLGDVIDELAGADAHSMDDFLVNLECSVAIRRSWECAE